MTGWSLAAIVGTGLLLAGASLGGSPLPAGAQTPEPTSAPHMDRLALPVLPDHATAAQTGEYFYYYDCMPCHGDRGQGLTDEFRQLWVEDHQDCWARGCHAGRPGEEGFPLPRSIPAVIGGDQDLGRFPTIGDLEAYLRLTHPPQRPGKLDEEEYRDLAAYLWQANGRQAPQGDARSANLLAGGTLAILAGSLLTAWAAAQRQQRRGETPPVRTGSTPTSV